IFNIAMLIFACLLVWLFYRRKRQFPMVFVWVMGISIFVNLCDHVLASALPLTTPTNWARFVGYALVALLWIGYMRRSRRVRNTFVE
ncbi:MAG: hypothetical protein DMD58_05785, partial [Gemmatimonadetes bacterium]